MSKVKLELVADNGKVIIFRPYLIQQMKDNQEKLNQIANLDDANISPQLWDEILDLLLLSAKRAQPEIKKNEIAGTVDMSDLTDIIQIISGNQPEGIPDPNVSKSVEQEQQPTN